MIATEISYTARAAKARKWAKINRISSTVCFVLAGIFTILAIYFSIVGGKPSSILVIFTSVIIITSSAFHLRISAAEELRTAQRWERLAKGVSW